MLIIAHRAGTDKYPEQSIPAARYSLENGADMVELDVRLTRDGAPVVCHDANALRLFGEDMIIEECELRDFLSLRNKYDPSIATYTLDTALALRLTPALLHLKFADTRSLAIVIEALKRARAGRVILGALTPEAAGVIRRMAPEYECLAFMGGADDTDAFLKERFDYIRLWEKWVTRERVDYIRARGAKVAIMSGEPHSVGYTAWDNLRVWRDMGADAVLINEVVKARELVKEERL